MMTLVGLMAYHLFFSAKFIAYINTLINQNTSQKPKSKPCITVKKNWIVESDGTDFESQHNHSLARWIWVSYLASSVKQR